MFYDSEFIGTCTPDSSGSYNNAGDISDNTTCMNLPYCLNGWEDINPALCGIVPLQVSGSNPDHLSDFGFQIPDFDNADPSTACTSLVRAIQGSLEVDAEVAGDPSNTALVLFTVSPSNGSSICTGGSSPAVGSFICGQEEATNPGAALITQPEAAGVPYVSFNSGIPDANSGSNLVLGGVGVYQGALFIGLGDKVPQVTNIPAGPDPSLSNPGTLCEGMLPSSTGNLNLSGINCSTTSLVVNGTITLNPGAIIYVAGDLTVNGNVVGEGTIFVTGTTLVTGSVNLNSGDGVYALQSGANMDLCGNTTPCPASPSSPTPTATATLTPTPTPTASATPSATPSATTTATASPTASTTASASATRTATSTATPTRTATATLTATATATETETPTPTPTQTPGGGRISVSPKSLSLSALPNASASGSITISNTGTGLLLADVTAPAHSPPFTETGGGSGIPIGPGGFHKVTIGYAPAKKGSTSDQIVITSVGADQKKPIKVKLKGKSK